MKIEEKNLLDPRTLTKPKSAILLQFFHHSLNDHQTNRFVVSDHYENLKKKSNCDSIQAHLTNNKRDAQAAGADPFRCNSTNRQNPPIQLNYCNF